jgi:hypothetical protein
MNRMLLQSRWPEICVRKQQTMSDGQASADRPMQRSVEAAGREFTNQRNNQSVRFCYA